MCEQVRLPTISVSPSILSSGSLWELHETQIRSFALSVWSSNHTQRGRPNRTHILRSKVRKKTIVFVHSLRTQRVSFSSSS
jgi:hypothetical protein